MNILKANILPPSTHTIVFSKRAYQKPPDDIVNYSSEDSETSETPFGSKSASISPPLESFLRESSLSIYQQKLIDLGWEDLTFLRTRSEDELKEIATSVGMKPGHRAKFVFYILK